MNHFFRASSWKLDNIKLKWFEAVATVGYIFGDVGILAGNVTKIFTGNCTNTIMYYENIEFS